jgi:uncharacterized protein (TIGR00297 family)
MRFSAQIVGVWAGLSVPSGRQLCMALAVTLAFAGLARLVRGVTFSGAVAGAVICFVLYAGAGPGAFAALVSVFVLAWFTTRLGYQQKQKLGTAERREGRTASQVLANLSVAAACAAIYATFNRNGIFLLAMAAALSEAAADTVSSELGQVRSQEARLITTWKQVPAGTDGGVSPAGTLAGIVAAALVSLVCFASGLLPTRWLGISVTAATAGMLADSYLGASLERRRWLNNNAVNFLSTLIAAGVAFLLA